MYYQRKIMSEIIMVASVLKPPTSPADNGKVLPFHFSNILSSKEMSTGLHLFMKLLLPASAARS